MKEKGYGRILMTTSAAGLYGNFGQTNYAAAKMGLVGLMNSLKLEGEKYNVRVNTIAPLAASRLTEDVTPPELFQKMKPEFVAPLALYLCSEQCPVSGSIYNAGMGFFNRAAVVTGPGLTLGSAGTFPALEDIITNLEAISTLEGGKEYSQLNAQVGDVLTALQGPQKAAAPKSAQKAAAKGFETPSAVFEAMPGAFKPDAASGVNVVFQYIISGAGGGNWSCAIRNQSCSVATGQHDSPTCTLKIADADFLDMMNGKLNPMLAYTSGKLKIEGDIMKSQLIEKLFAMK
jgi:putative sterol carrier protein